MKGEDARLGAAAAGTPAARDLIGSSQHRVVVSLLDVEVELRKDTASRSCRERNEWHQNEQGEGAAERHDREAVMTATAASGAKK